MQENVESYAQSMKRKYMTYDVLYEEYCKATDNPYGYTQFKLIIQEYEKAHEYKYHNFYEAAQHWSLHYGTDMSGCRSHNLATKVPQRAL